MVLSILSGTSGAPPNLLSSQDRTVPIYKPGNHKLATVALVFELVQMLDEYSSFGGKGPIGVLPRNPGNHGLATVAMVIVRFGFSSLKFKFGLCYHI